MPKLSKGELARDKNWGKRVTNQRRKTAAQVRRDQHEQQLRETDLTIAMATVLVSAVGSYRSRLRERFRNTTIFHKLLELKPFFGL